MRSYDWMQNSNWSWIAGGLHVSLLHWWSRYLGQCVHHYFPINKCLSSWCICYPSLNHGQTCSQSNHAETSTFPIWKVDPQCHQWICFIGSWTSNIFLMPSLMFILLTPSFMCILLKPSLMFKGTQQFFFWKFPRGLSTCNDLPSIDVSVSPFQVCICSPGLYILAHTHSPLAPNDNCDLVIGRNTWSIGPGTIRVWSRAGNEEIELLQPHGLI